MKEEAWWSKTIRYRSASIGLFYYAKVREGKYRGGGIIGWNIEKDGRGRRTTTVSRRSCATAHRHGPLRLDHSVDYLALWCGEYTMPIWRGGLVHSEGGGSHGNAGTRECRLQRQPSPSSLPPFLATPARWGHPSPARQPSFRRQPPLDRRAKATPKLGPVTDPYVLLPSLPPPSPPPRAPYVYYTLCALRPPVDRAFLSFLPSLPARVRVRVLLSVAATSIHVARTRNKLASVRDAETVRVTVYRQPPGMPPRSIWWTDAPTPSTGRPTRFTKFPPTTSSPNFFSFQCLYPSLSLSFSKCVWRLSSNENQFSILRGIGDFSSDFN